MFAWRIPATPCGGDPFRRPWAAAASAASSPFPPGSKGTCGAQHAACPPPPQIFAMAVDTEELSVSRGPSKPADSSGEHQDGVAVRGHPTLPTWGGGSLAPWIRRRNGALRTCTGSWAGRLGDAMGRANAFSSVSIPSHPNRLTPARSCPADDHDGKPCGHSLARCRTDPCMCCLCATLAQSGGDGSFAPAAKGRAGPRFMVDGGARAQDPSRLSSGDSVPKNSPVTPRLFCYYCDHQEPRDRSHYCSATTYCESRVSMPREFYQHASQMCSGTWTPALMLDTHDMHAVRALHLVRLVMAAEAQAPPLTRQALACRTTTGRECNGRARQLGAGEETRRKQCLRRLGSPVVGVQVTVREGLVWEGLVR